MSINGLSDTLYNFTGSRGLGAWKNISKPVEQTGFRSWESAMRRRCPYSEMADKDGIISYHGVSFVCDYERNAICLGDMSDERNVLVIPLSGGGSLKVNRDNLDDLARAVGMFSAEDRNRIMRAITTDAKVQKMRQEIEDEKAGIGEKIVSEEKE